MARISGRLERVASPDGTPIAVHRSGQGRPLVLVHGTTATAARWQAVLPLLEDHVTACAVDRRGRGASGDGTAYSLAREAEDVAAVVDAVGADAADDGGADLLGHSYGALVALEAAFLTTRVRRLVLYEPVVTGEGSFPPGTEARFVELLAQGRREDVVVELLRDLAGIPEEDLALMRADPSWAERVAAAHTVVRETQAESDYTFEPARFAALHLPTLLLDGTESPDMCRRSTALVAAAVPGAQVEVLRGQGHVAMVSAPELFVAAVLAFLA